MLLLLLLLRVKELLLLKQHHQQLLHCLHEGCLGGRKLLLTLALSAAMCDLLLLLVSQTWAGVYGLPVPDVSLPQGCRQGQHSQIGLDLNTGRMIVSGGTKMIFFLNYVSNNDPFPLPPAAAAECNLSLELASTVATVATVATVLASTVA